MAMTLTGRAATHTYPQGHLTSPKTKVFDSLVFKKLFEIMTPGKETSS